MDCFPSQWPCHVYIFYSHWWMDTIGSLPWIAKWKHYMKCKLYIFMWNDIPGLISEPRVAWFALVWTPVSSGQYVYSWTSWYTGKEFSFNMSMYCNLFISLVLSHVICFSCLQVVMCPCIPRCLVLYHYTIYTVLTKLTVFHKLSCM